MSVVMLVDSIFHLHTLEVLVVPFLDLRDLYSYSYSILDWRSSSDAGLNVVRRSSDQFPFVLLRLA